MGILCRYGIRGLVIDPYNELDHQRPAAMTETEYVSQMLGKIKRFAQVRYRARYRVLRGAVQDSKGVLRQIKRSRRCGAPWRRRTWLCSASGRQLRAATLARPCRLGGLPVNARS